MAQSIPPDLVNDSNAPVLAYIKDLSAHSDIADALTTSVEFCGDVQTFCPDPIHYRYVVVSTKGIIFGLAVGMKMIAYRLDTRMKSRAIVTGATPFSECGDDWALFTLWQDADWPKVDLPFWALKAYVYARETGTNTVHRDKQG